METYVYEGDCLGIMQKFEANSIDLIYLDPPFFSQKTHTLRSRDGQKEFSFADLWSSHFEYGEKPPTKHAS